MRTRTAVCCLALAFLATPVSSTAQEAPSSELLGRTVRAWTGSQVLEGEVTAVRPEGVVLTSVAGETRVEWSSMEYLNVLTVRPRTGLYALGGALLVGGLAGVIAGLAEACISFDVPCDPDDEGRALAMGLIIGGAVGAGLGVLVGHRRPSRKWTPVVIPGSGGEGGAWQLGLSVRPGG